MKTNNREVVNHFIEKIWNHKEFEMLDVFFHPNFVDHSLPATLPPNQEGLKRWIEGTCKAFENTTVIEDMICEGEKVVVKIKMLMKHVGRWRDIEPLGTAVIADGYRYFKLKDNKIIEHWALIDGAAVENHLKEANNSCNIH